MVQQSIFNALRRAGSPRRVATVITQVIVDPTDKALQEPTKFIGHALTAERAAELEKEGFKVKLDGHKKMRRVVGSPAPRSIHELETIRLLLSTGTIVIACGGGGVPVYEHPTLGLEGIDAVVDKDLVSAVLARDLGAQMLLILTDVDAVYADWGTPKQRPLSRISLDEAAAMDKAGAFGEGSMAPKIRGAMDFVRRAGGRAIITALDRGREAVYGKAGTTITAKSENE